MYDTIDFTLYHGDAGGVDFLEETPCYFEFKEKRETYDGNPYLLGSLNGLRLSVDARRVKVYGGSLCKWYLGDNIKTMTRGDIQRAIEKLSDDLHLPMGSAVVSRIDVAQNFETRYPVDVYLGHFGKLGRKEPLRQPSSVYYDIPGGRVCIYDKIREMKEKRKPFPSIYKHVNVLRYERRHTDRIAQRLGMDVVTASTLYDEAFYIRLLDDWRNTFMAIQKLNDTSLNWEVVRTKKQLYNMGLLALFEKTGGQLQTRTQIEAAAKRGQLTRKQALDLRRAVDDAYQIDGGFAVRNDAVHELERRVREAVRFYR